MQIKDYLNGKVQKKKKKWHLGHFFAKNRFRELSILSTIANIS